MLYGTSTVSGTERGFRQEEYSWRPPPFYRRPLAAARKRRLHRPKRLLASGTTHRITAVEDRLADAEAKIGTLSTAVGVLQETPAGESFAAGTYTATVTCPEDWDGFGAPSGHLLAGPDRMLVYRSKTFTLYTRTTLIPVDVVTGCEMSIVRI